MYLIAQITQRLGEINTLLATKQQGSLSFEQALQLSSFYQEYNDTNRLVKEAGLLFSENTEKLLESSSLLLSETSNFLSFDMSELQDVDFEHIFREHINPFKARYDKARTVAADDPHANINLLYHEWQQEEKRCFCVYCFKPMFLEVLVERLKGIAGSIVSDIKRVS